MLRLYIKVIMILDNQRFPYVCMYVCVRVCMCVRDGSKLRCPSRKALWLFNVSSTRIAPRSVPRGTGRDSVGAPENIVGGVVVVYSVFRCRLLI